MCIVAGRKAFRKDEAYTGGGAPLFLDAREVTHGTVLETDVAIVGAGAAGITLARELAGRPFQVCVLESGGLDLDKATQSLAGGESVGLPYYPLEATRLRYFGGTTNHWGGWCRPLDPIDFEIRAWVPYSGWPFPKTRLDPYYQRAQAICQLGPFSYDAEAWEDSKDRRRLPFNGERVVSTMWQIGPPTRFGPAYRDDLARASNIRTYLYANVVELATTEHAGQVTRLRVAGLHGRVFWVTAKLFILAAGGIENARLLLLSSAVQQTGLGNRHNLVGRFFLEHPQLWSGPLLLSQPTIPMALYNIQTVAQTTVAGCLTLAEEVQRRERLLNGCVFLHPALPGPDDELDAHLGQVIGDIDALGESATGRGTRPPSAKRYRLFLRPEPAPHPDSRVTLGEARDSLGQRRARLHWQLSPMIRQSVGRALEILGEETGRAGLGRVRVSRDDEQTAWARPQGGYHHMGTTRMHVDPKQGVVDADCRVHGLSNLFIAGSSVFPTAGYANPTLTIVALALRLADRIKVLMT